MTEIVADHPDFAPAHGSLAEIYASTIFHDESKEKTERERFSLCALHLRSGSGRPGYPTRVS